MLVAVAMSLVWFCAVQSAPARGAEPGTRTAFLQANGPARTIHVPPFGFYGNPRCDNSGDVFFHADTGSFSDLTILEVAHDGRAIPIQVPAEPSHVADYVDFAVSPSGRLYMLALAPATRTYSLLAFASDGTVSSRTQMDIPPDVIAKHLAVFEDGVILISGFGTDANPALRGKSYAALFEPSGKLRANLAGFTDMGLKDLSKKIEEGDFTVGRGNAYVLRKDDVIVLSERGQILDRLTLATRDPAYSTTQINYSQGLLSIALVTDQTLKTMHRLSFRFLVLDAVSGEVRALYEPGDDATNNANLCFSRTEGYTFEDTDPGDVKFLNAPLN